jgi:hypothetical protein
MAEVRAPCLVTEEARDRHMQALRKALQGFY